jgi:hypothetical protein
MSNLSHGIKHWREFERSPFLPSFEITLLTTLISRLFYHLLSLSNGSRIFSIDWRTKGVEPWAKQWFIDNLVGTEANGVEIIEVTDVEGDCEVGMRKSKLITVYDQKVRCS